MRELFGRPVLRVRLDPLTAYRAVLEPEVLDPIGRHPSVPDAVLDDLGSRHPHLLPAVHIRRSSFIFHEAYLLWDLEAEQTWSLAGQFADPMREEGDIAQVLAARLRRASRIYLKDEWRNRRGMLGEPDENSLAWDAAADHLES